MPTMAAAFGTNSGSVLIHQLRRLAQRDLVLAQDTPDVVLGDAQLFGKQRTRPGGVSLRRRLIQGRQDALFGGRGVFRRFCRERGLSCSPFSPTWWKRLRHLLTVSLRVCRVHARCHGFDHRAQQTEQYVLAKPVVARPCPSGSTLKTFSRSLSLSSITGAILPIAVVSSEGVIQGEPIYGQEYN